MKWTRGPMIGQGSSATVSTATVTSSGEILAVKSADLRRSVPLQHEQRILSSLSCPYIVTYKGHDVTTENNLTSYNIFLENLPRGTLVDEIRRNGGKLGEPMIVHYSRQIVRGLDHLHSRGLVHCDIKGRNILIGEDDVAKIADFGCAKWAHDPGLCRGTPGFMAPEVARGEGQGPAADIWAFGCTVVEMAIGRSPLGGDSGDPVSVLYRVGFCGESPEIPGRLSVQAKDFLEKCLRRIPEERWTTSQLLDHPFLAGPASPNPIEVSGSGLTSSSNPIEVSGSGLASSSSSPTSVLDFGFWNSTRKELQIIENSSQCLRSLGTTKESDVDRLGHLAGSSGRVPEWRWVDEGWMVVRENLGGCDNDERGLHGSDWDGLRQKGQEVGYVRWELPKFKDNRRESFIRSPRT